MSTPTSDAHSMMLYEANKKSAGLAFALWFFLGFLGAHRFYMGKIGSGIGMIVLTFFGILTIQGPFLIIAAAIWVIVDAFLISGWVRQYNMDLVSKISSGNASSVSA